MPGGHALKRRWSTMLLVALLSVSCAVHIVTLVKLNLVERQLESTVDAEAAQRLVDERVGVYADIMREGASFDTTSTEATFWWVGYAAGRAYEDEAEFNAAFENSLHANPVLATTFHAVHQVIDGRVWPSAETTEPFLTYTEK